MSININEISNKFWNIADLLRDTLEENEIMYLILSLLMLKRFDNEILKQNQGISEKYEEFTKQNVSENVKENQIFNFFEVKYFNHAKIRFNTILNDGSKIIENLKLYIDNFSSNVKEIFDSKHLNLIHYIDKIENIKLVESLLEKIINIDINDADTQDIGSIFEELLRKFSENTAKKAGAFYTPRDIVKLLVKILISNLKDKETKTIYDCACGTGGILNGCYKELKNRVRNVELYGQEKNGNTWAIAKGEMLMQEIDSEIIKGNTLIDDKIKKQFDYIGANPPFGVDWKEEFNKIDKNEERYSKGLPGKDDGQLLFDMTCLMKLNSKGRAVIIHDLGSLSKGAITSGESKIRKFILENNLLECVILLPENLFFNTSTSTCMLVYSKRKDENRKNKLQIINARKIFTKLSSALNKKQVELSDENIETILKEYNNFKETEISKIVDINEFKQTNKKGVVGYKIEFNKYFPTEEEIFEDPEVIFERILKKKQELDESFEILTK
jgi:type I restriction enzyme M protein